MTFACRFAAFALVGALALGVAGLIGCSPALDGGGLLEKAQVGSVELAYPAGFDLVEQAPEERYLRASATLEGPDGLSILVREYGGVALDDLRRAAEESSDANMALALAPTTVDGREALRLEGRAGDEHVAFCYVDLGNGTTAVVGTTCDEAVWKANEAAIETVLSHIEVA